MSKYRFIDFFSGIGGFHIALSNVGMNCVAACDIDKYARITYQHNFYKENKDLFDKGYFFKDIHLVDSREIPDFDIFCGGFPCQPFSQAGHKLGFEDKRGNLFFEIARIIKDKRPKAFFLENVRHLINHDGGRTLQIIKEVLTEELGYTFYYKVIKASDFGLPQHRARVFIVGFNKEGMNPLPEDFVFPEPIKLKMNMSDVLGGKCDKRIGYTLRVGGRGSGVHDRRNWDGYIVDGKEIRIGIEEGKKMMGFPIHYHFPVSATQAMKQLGNSVAINPIQATADAIKKYIDRHLSDTKGHDNVKQVRTEGILRISETSLGKIPATMR